MTTAPPHRDRLYALDGLRLICALAVAGFHYGVSWRIDGVHPPAYHLPLSSHVLIYGFLGVEVFFLISGFVICMSGWGRGLRDFLASRAGRLYPALWACVLITAGVVTLLPVTTGVPVPAAPFTGEVIAANMSMLAEPLGYPLVDTVYWTLWLELRFYLLFALLTLTGTTRNRVAAFATCWLIAAAVLPQVQHGLLAEQIVMPSFAPYFVAGMTLYLMRRFGPSAWLWLLLAGSWLLSLNRVHFRILDVYPGFPVPTWPAPVIITVAYLLLLFIALRGTDRLNWRPLAVAGALTYPFYLLHQRVGYSVIRYLHERTDLPASVLLVTAMAVVLTLAWLVHRLVERPLMPVVRRLVGGPRRRPATADLSPGPGPGADPRPEPRPETSSEPRLEPLVAVPPPGGAGR